MLSAGALEAQLSSSPPKEEVAYRLGTEIQTPLKPLAKETVEKQHRILENLR